MTPYAIRTLHLPEFAAMLGTLTLGITGGLGALAGGFLADRWGIRVVVVAPRILLMLLLFPVMKFLIASPSAATLVLAIAILSLLHAASVAVAVMLVPLIFPRAVRATGLSITYSLAVAVFGGTATYIVTWLVGVTGDPLASTYYVMAANIVLLLAALAVRTPTTADRTLAAASGKGGLRARGRWRALHAQPGQRIRAIVSERPLKARNSTDLDRASKFTRSRARSGQADIRGGRARAPAAAGSVRPSDEQEPGRAFSALPQPDRRIHRRDPGERLQSQHRDPVRRLHDGPDSRQLHAVPALFANSVCPAAFSDRVPLLFAVLIPRYPRRGSKNFLVSRTATADDFVNVAETEDEIEQLKLRCAVLSELLWWKTLYIRISFVAVDDQHIG